jgi:hypothetical protein
MQNVDQYTPILVDGLMCMTGQIHYLCKFINYFWGYKEQQNR